jgi:hypothetical protein
MTSCSLGCVYLECILWWLEGFEAVQQYVGERVMGDPVPGAMQDERFFIERRLPEGTSTDVKPVIYRYDAGLGLELN